VEFIALSLIPAALALVVWLAARANELCKIKVIDGAPRLVRGRVPAGFMGDVSDIVTRGRVARGTIRVVSERGVPRLVSAPGELGPIVVQQLRNVVGQYRTLHFRTGRRSS
jgi:hypothetical protein